MVAAITLTGCRTFAAYIILLCPWSKLLYTLKCPAFVKCELTVLNVFFNQSKLRNKLKFPLHDGG